MDDITKIKNAKLLVYRLGRISADSALAHKVSGIRGSILKMLDLPINELSAGEEELLDELMITASRYLEQACIELLS
ncbi:hypothetical protein ACFLXB_03080 [Chloroflexota bacterium]